jgi:hypothetical protein
MPDTQVAAQTGRTKAAVSLKRRKLGISLSRPGGRGGSPGPRWTEEEVALLGTMPDEQVAAQTGRTKVAVYLKRRKLGLARCPLSDGSGPRWTEEEVALLGTAPDEEIARQTGRTERSVYLKRWKRSIASPFAGRRRDSKQ